MTLAIRSSPRRISLAGAVDTRPSTSGATMAGQKNRRNMKAPTAVYLASGNRGTTAFEIYTGSVARLRPSAYGGLTIWQILRNEGGMLEDEAHMSSINTFATIRSCRAFFCNSSVVLTLAGSSSKSRSFDVSISLSSTFCRVARRYEEPFHLA